MASLGQSLREEREARNISIEEIASATKIVPRYLEALEADHLDQMPGGILRQGDHPHLCPGHRARPGRGPGQVQGGRASRRAGSRPAGRAYDPPGAALPSGRLPRRLRRSSRPSRSPRPEAPESLPAARRPSLSSSSKKPPSRGSPPPPGSASSPGPGAAPARCSSWSSSSSSGHPGARGRLKSPPAAGRRPGGRFPRPEKTEPGRAGPRRGRRPLPTRPPRPSSEARASARRRGGLEGRHDRDLLPGRDLDPGPHRRRAQGRRPLPRRGDGPGPGRTKELLIHTGNAGGFTFRLNGRPAKPLGRSGQVLTDIKITPENLKDFLEDPAVRPVRRADARPHAPERLNPCPPTRRKPSSCGRSNVGDQDKIAVFFCREKGVIRGVAKGARKFGNRFGSSLEPMSVVRVFYYEKERRDLITVSGCDLLESFFEIQAEPGHGLPPDLLRRAHRGVRPDPGPRGRPLPAPPVRPPLPQGRRRPGVRGGLLRGLVPPGQRAPPRPRRLPEMPQAPRPGLARPQEGRRLLPGLRPVQEGRGPARDPGFPPLGPQEPAARGLRPAVPGRRYRRDPEVAPGHDRLPYGAGAADPAFPQDEVTPICYNWWNIIDATSSSHDCGRGTTEEAQLK